MKFNRITLSVLIIIISIFAFFSLSSAMDTDACLFCHQYPGLVKSGEKGDFTILHINEEKYRKSVHGKTNCNECHTKVTKVPHTGLSGTDCTVTCHQKDRDKILATGQAELKALHKEEKFSITDLGDSSSCRVCHPLYPHRTNNRVRSFINIHTGYLYCEVCHLKKELRPGVLYDWSSPESVEFQGEPYGTRHSKEEMPSSKSLAAGILQIFSSKDKGSKSTDKVKYTISRIAPHTLSGSRKIPLINTTDSKSAEEFMKKEKNMPSEEKEEKLNYFHRDIAKKEISVACNECHSPAGILDFVKLGFDERTAKDLQYLNIKGLVTKYDTFYFPNLFGK